MQFFDNGGCGYVLKPEWMRPTKCLPSGCAAPARAASVLQVTVLSAHAHVGAAISFWKPDVFVSVEVAGVPCDTARRNTRVAVNSGRLLAEETFEFRILYPEVAQVRLALRYSAARGMADPHLLPLGKHHLQHGALLRVAATQ